MDKMVISVPVSVEKHAFRKALKAVAADSGQTIGEFIAALLERECGEKLAVYVGNFSTMTGYISEQLATSEIKRSSS